MAPGSESSSGYAGSSSGSEGGVPVHSTSSKHGSSSENTASTSDAAQPRSLAERSAARTKTELKSHSVNSTSQGAPAPALTLAAYPGPGAGQQHPSSATSLLPSPIARANSNNAVTHPGEERSSIPGSTTQSFITAFQEMSLKPTDGASRPAYQNLHDKICELQKRLWGLRQGIYLQPGIPPQFLGSIDLDMRVLVSIVSSVYKAADNLGEETKKLVDECEHLKNRLHQLELEAQSWKGCKDQLEVERSRLMARSMEDMKAVKALTDQLRQAEMAKMILQDQVDGKRSLWLEVHRDPQEQAAAMRNINRNATPLGGPSFAKPMNQNQSFNPRQTEAARLGAIRSGSLHSSLHPGAAQPAGQYNPNGHLQGQAMGRSYSSSGPLPLAPMGQFQHQPRLSSATVNTARTSTGNANGRSFGTAPAHTSSVPQRSPRAPGTTELGSPNERKRVPTSVLAGPGINDGECKKWSDEFQGLFALISGFCESYFHSLPHIDGDWRSHIQAQADGALWNYVCQVCQPGDEQERANRAMSLMMDDVCRPYIIQRLIVQHIIVFVFSYEGWKDYSEDIDDEMEKLEKDLQNIDPRKTYERQAIIDRRAALVAEMASGPHAPAFKNHKVNQHHQHLKTMVGPFLSRDKKSNTTQEAFYDLFSIANLAWELSAKLFQSRLTFQYIWNDVHTRFSAETHRCLGINLDPVMLQQEYWRIKLCVTPAITLRNDQGMTINAKNILKSGVLVMRY